MDSGSRSRTSFISSYFMISKKTLLFVSGLLSVGLLVWNYVGNYRICDLLIKAGSTGSCPFILTNIGINLLPTIPFFFLSLITYKMREDVYQSWARFAVVWVLLSMILIFLAPEYSSSFGITLYPVTKGSVAFISSLLFVIISLVLIIWKYFVSRRAPF